MFCIQRTHILYVICITQLNQTFQHMNILQPIKREGSDGGIIGYYLTALRSTNITSTLWKYTFMQSFVALLVCAVVHYIKIIN